MSKANNAVAKKEIRAEITDYELEKEGVFEEEEAVSFVQRLLADGAIPGCDCGCDGDLIITVEELYGLLQASYEYDVDSDEDEDNRYYDCFD